MGTSQSSQLPVPRRLEDVPGWLKFTDRLLFEWLLRRQTATGIVGDLLELGVFQGRTSIHIGRFLQEGERFTVCDLFDLAKEDETIRPGARKAYRDLTRETFERNFLAFHKTLPTIVTGRTEVIVDHVEPGSCRFVHIDASHMYEHVRTDLRSAKKVMRPDGVVVFDDYRTEHCPGTAAAVWEAMATDGLKVLCVTANKFYGTWGDPDETHAALAEMIAKRNDHRGDFQSVMGQKLIRVVRLPKATDTQASNGKGSDGDVRKLLLQSEQALATARVLAKSARQRDARQSRGRQGWRRAAVAITPPIIIQGVRNVRHRRAVRAEASNSA